MKLTNTIVAKLEAKDKAYEVYDSELKGFLVRVQPTGNKTYYYSYPSPEGVRRRIKLGRHGEIATPQARDTAVKHAGSVASGVDVQAQKKTLVADHKKKANRTLERFLINYYEDWAKVHLQSGKEAVFTIKRNFSQFYDLPLEEITVIRMQQWQTAQLKRGLKPSSINRIAYCLQSVLTAAVSQGIIAQHPLGKLKPLEVPDNTIVRFLSVAEDTKLRKALAAREAKMREERVSANKWRTERGYPLHPEIAEGEYADHLTPMILISLNTGIRRGELFRLCWQDVSFSKKLFTVRGVNTKNNKTRHIPMNSEMLAALKQWKSQSKESELIFPSKGDAPFDNVNTAWKALLDAAGIKKFRWHDLRHTFASNLVMAGVDLNTVRELMGHADIKMTLRYAHLAPEHKADAVAKLVRN